MKKMLTLLLVVVALVAVASNASAITCTIDQRPAATLLVPYFQVSIGSNGTIPADTTYRDTIVTIGNASTASVLAHVSVWNHRSVLALDFEVALTPNDIQSMLMSSILTGNLPDTPNQGPPTGGSPGVPSAFIPTGDDACQRNPNADVYPMSDGFLRFRPSIPAGGLDNANASTWYPQPAFSNNGSFAKRIYDILDTDANDDCDTDSPDGVNSGLLTGYITIDMVNYCTLTSANSLSFFTADAAGWENDLWGDYILKSGSGLPTYGNPTVNLEAATGLPCNGGFEGTAGAQGSLNGCVLDPVNGTSVVRTFYARYWEDPDFGNIAGDTGVTLNGAGSTSENCYLAGGIGCVNLVGVYPYLVGNTWGDMREPLGGNYAARFVTSEGISSFLRVWRAGAGSRVDLTGGSCTDEEASPGITLYDEDENTTTTGVCPSPCSNPPVNIPFETQRDDITVLFGSGLPGPDGWINVNLINSGDALATALDQGWVGYDFETSAAFLNAGIEGTQLDQSDCYPVDPASLGSTLPLSINGVLDILPAIPSH